MRHRFNPWSRKIPHAVEQLSPCSRALEQKLLKPMCLEPVLHRERSHCKEKTKHRNSRVALLTATGESQNAAAKTQGSQTQYKKLK